MTSTNRWHSLYLISSENSTPEIAEALRDHLVAGGYTPYNPFGILPGKSYAHTIRLFVAPTVDGWTRVLVEGDLPPTAAASSRAACVLWTAIDGDQHTIAVYQNGESVDPAGALVAYLREGVGVEELHRALTDPVLTVLAPDDQPAVLPITVLPGDLQAMADQTNSADFDKMFNKMTGNLFGKRGGANPEDMEQARAVIGQAQGVDWNSGSGQRIRLLMSLLTAPETWRDPDFVTLRNAYSLHARRQRKPDARLYPGDAEAMAAVANALDYVPVYVGKDD